MRSYNMRAPLAVDVSSRIAYRCLGRIENGVGLSLAGGNWVIAFGMRAI